jgi:hypothetical protein
VGQSRLFHKHSRKLSFGTREAGALSVADYAQAHGYGPFVSRQHGSGWERNGDLYNCTRGSYLGTPWPCRLPIALPVVLPASIFGCDDKAPRQLEHLLAPCWLQVGQRREEAPSWTRHTPGCHQLSGYVYYHVVVRARPGSDRSTRLAVERGSRAGCREGARRERAGWAVGVGAT